MSEIVADHMPDGFGPMSLGEALAYNSALEYAAKWIEDAAFGNQVLFANNMAMSIRAAKQPIEQEDFFDAVRNDPDMTPERKAKWLSLEVIISDEEAEQ